MMKKIILFIFLVWLQLLSAQNRSGLNIEEIFNPFGNVNFTYQDKKGLLWCASNEGFSRYDGFSFTPVYSGDPVICLSEDDYGNILGGTLNGEVVIYNRSTAKTKSFSLKPDPLFYYSPKEFSRLPEAFSFYKNLTVTSLAVAKDQLYVGTWGSGIFIFDLANEMQKEHLFNIKDEKSLPANFITSILVPKNNSDIFFCSSYDAGLVKVNLKQKLFDNFLPDIQFTSLCSDDKSFYGGSIQGLVKTDSNFASSGIISKESITSVFLKTDLYATVPGKGILKIIPDRNDKIQQLMSFENHNDFKNAAVDLTGIIWAAQNAGSGLIKITADHKFISGIQISDINSLTASTQNEIYFSSGKNKLYKYSFINNKITLIKAGLLEIRSLLFTNEGSLLISSGKDLLSLDLKNNSFSKLISEVYVTSLTETPDGIIWAGTFDDGLIRIEHNKKSFYRKSNIYSGAIPDNYIKRVFVSENNLWGYTKEGYLFTFVKSKDEFISYKLNTGMFNILSAFSRGEDIYLGTYGDGLYRFNKKLEKFYRLNDRIISGIKNIFGILADNEKNLWIATENSLIKYNTLNNQLYYFNERDGVQEKHFNPSVSSVSNGIFIFGGSNGVTYFNPLEKEISVEIPKISITSFKVQNEEIHINSLPLQLNNQENSISITFCSLDYYDPYKNQYKWILEGFDTSFHFSFGSARTAVYNNLPAGKYRFVLWGANASGIWSKKGLVIPMEISLPYYKTWWFIILSFLLIVTLPGYFIYMKILNKRAINKIKERLSADLHDDIGSGLTEISLLSELLKNKSKGNIELTDQLNFISQRARELILNMSDIVWLVNPGEVYMKDLIIRIKNKICPVTESLGIGFVAEVDDNIVDEVLSIEQKQNIYLILKEAVNNSLKYSKAGKISLKLFKDESDFKIIIKDNGNGFDAIRQVTGNGIRNMKTRAEAIGCSFSISSNESGTTIILEGKL